VKPDVSVVIVADYAAGDPRTYEHLRGVLEAVARQTFRGSKEMLLLESKRFRERLPADLAAESNARLVLVAAEDSFSLRNVGVREAAADLIVFLDADCMPDRDWLERLVSAITSHPGVVAVSGRTTYGGTGLVERTLSLLSRTYVERGEAGPARHLSNNNAVYRKAALVAHPFPSGSNPFVSALQAGALMADGGCLWFEPAARVVHLYGGLRAELDVSRNAGWAAIAIRQTDSHARLASLVRFGALAIPVFTAICLLRSWSRLLRFHRIYGLAWFELPAALGVALLTSLMQIPGMWKALRRQPIVDTPYR
jgi:hypothetical protein